MSWFQFVRDWLGLAVEPKDLTFLQVSLRGIVVFITTLVILRVADRRFLAKLSAFDAILGLILASMLARAVNGSAPFFPTLGGGFVIVILHRLIGKLAFHSDNFGKLIKGEADMLVRDGKALPKSMRRHLISKDDLLEEVRLNGHIAELENIRTATLERNGEISVVSKKDQ